MSFYLYEIRQKQEQLRKKLADDEAKTKAKLQEEQKQQQELQEKLKKGGKDGKDGRDGKDAKAGRAAADSKQR